MESHCDVLTDTVERIYDAAAPLQKFFKSPQNLKHQDVFLEIASGLLLEQGASVQDIVDLVYEYSVKIFTFLRHGERSNELSEISDEMLDFERCRHIYESATHVDVRILLIGDITLLHVRFIILNAGYAPHVA